MVLTDDTEFELSHERKGLFFGSKSRDLDGDIDPGITRSRRRRTWFFGRKGKMSWRHARTAIQFCEGPTDPVAADERTMDEGTSRIGWPKRGED